MKITVKLFATFREGRFKERGEELPEGTTCRDIVLGLGLKEDEVGVVLVNGRHAGLDAALRDGDTLALFPQIGGG